MDLFAAFLDALIASFLAYKNGLLALRFLRELLDKPALRSRRFQA